MASLPLRGNADRANCAECPFGRYGKPNQPVFSEGPEDPAFIVLGEGPGRNEVMHRAPLVGPSGEIVEKMMISAGVAKVPWSPGPVKRFNVWLANATLCLPFQGATDEDKAKAAQCCSIRLKMELGQDGTTKDGRPTPKLAGKPILALGAVAARAVIPPHVLEAIDPPEKVGGHKRKAKNKLQEAERVKRKEERKRKMMLKVLGDQLFEQHMREHRGQKKPTKKYIEGRAVEELGRMQRAIANDRTPERERLIVRAQLDALTSEVEKRMAPKPKANAAPKKRRVAGISDIASTHFRVAIGDGKGTRSVIPTIHPAAILRGGVKLAGTHSPDLAIVNLYFDARKIARLAKGEPIILEFNTETEHQDPQRATDLFLKIYREIQEHGEFALDLETYVEDSDRHHALQMYVAKIRAIGLATPKYGVAVLWDLLPAWCKNLLRILLLSKKIRRVAHNFHYDRTVLDANGYPSGEWECTMLGHHAAFPGMAHNLQMVTAQFRAVEPWKSEFRNNEETPEKLVEYCVRDTQSAAEIRPLVDFWIKQNKNEQVYAIDRKMAECASRMHLDGVPVSREVNAQLFETFTKIVQDSRLAVEQLADEPEKRKMIWHNLAFEQAKKQRKDDPEDFRARHQKRLAEIDTKFHKGKWIWKISANQHVAALLRTLGVQLLQLTDTGATKVNKEILESLVEVPIVREILRFRENDKRLMTFVWPMFDRRLNDGSLVYGFADGQSRVHPIWSVHKISGRWASTEPVCSNVPKEKIKKHPDGRIEILVPNLRAQVVAPPGRIFVGFDFAQLEARILAMVSGDEWLLNVFAQGLDIHREAAKIIFPGFDEKHEKIQKQLRDLAKPFEYGAFYGADPETLYKALLKAGHNMRREDVFKAYYTLMGRLVGLAKYQQQIVITGSTPPYEITSFLYKRRRTFPLGQADRNECLNFPIQSSAADIMNTGMERIMGRLHKYRQAFPILQIHDAAVFECWEDDAEQLKLDVVDCFTQEYTIRGVTIPFPIDAKIGRSWADV